MKNHVAKRRKSVILCSSEEDTSLNPKNKKEGKNSKDKSKFGGNGGFVRLWPSISHCRYGG